MKHSFLIASANALLNWNTNSYCDFNQFLVGDSVQTSQKNCLDFCGSKDNESTYAEGSEMCCGYELWEDATTSCYLYLGGATKKQDMVEYPNDYLSSMVFPHRRFGPPEEREAASKMTIGMGLIALFSIINY